MFVYLFVIWTASIGWYFALGGCSGAMALRGSDRAQQLGLISCDVRWLALGVGGKSLIEWDGWVLLAGESDVGLGWPFAAGWPFRPIPTDPFVPSTFAQLA